MCLIIAFCVHVFSHSEEGNFVGDAVTRAIRFVTVYVFIHRTVAAQLIAVPCRKPKHGVMDDITIKLKKMLLSRNFVLQVLLHWLSVQRTRVPIELTVVVNHGVYLYFWSRFAWFWSIGRVYTVGCTHYYLWSMIIYRGPVSGDAK